MAHKLKKCMALARATICRGRRHKPNFLIIGAQKSGTTSLHYYLNQHPCFSGSSPKELHFFDEKINFGKNYDWYESQFLGPKNRYYFESTPSYIYRPEVAEKIYSFSENIKLVALLRDPVKRAFSAYNHYRSSFIRGERSIARRREKQRPRGDQIYEFFFKNRSTFPTFREAIEIELEALKNKAFYDPALLRRGLYFEQIEHYLNVFGKDQLLLLGFRDLIETPQICLDQVSSFIGAGIFDWSSVDFSAKNVKTYHDQMTKEDELFLKDFYQAANSRLFEQIGPINW